MTADELYQDAYRTHYSSKQYSEAFNKYLLVITNFPNSNESRYAEQQINNLSKIINLETVAVDSAVLKTYEAYLQDYLEKKNLEDSKKKAELVAITRKEKIREQFKNSYKIENYICVDDKNCQWAIMDGDCISDVYNFEDLVSFEITENGNKIQGSSAGDVLIGSLLLGFTGAMMGMASSRPVEEFVYDLHITVVLNNISRPIQIIKIIDDPAHPINKTSTRYKYAVDLCEKIISAFRFIENRNKKVAQRTCEKARAIYAFSIADEILKFKQLLDDGVITSEEFEIQKRKLLALEY